ncbi:hypothetical protein ACETQG_04415 [Weissella cibaria]|uniref:hypothetical protein n=1 Tax=Weissella cibaria TaxID=137591 RepID=UPI0031B5DE16
MKKVLIWMGSLLGVIVVVWGTVLIIGQGGGFSINPQARTMHTSTGHRQWTKQDFDEQYDNIAATIVQPDLVKDERIKMGRSNTISRRTQTWHLAHATVVLRFYQYDEAGNWVLHDKTWLTK